MTSGEKYVAAVYGIVFIVVLVWAGIIALKLKRLERESAELVALARHREEQSEALDPPDIAGVRDAAGG